jgi:hypothetical protein
LIDLGLLALVLQAFSLEADPFLVAVMFKCLAGEASGNRCQKKADRIGDPFIPILPDEQAFFLNEVDDLS